MIRQPIVTIMGHVDHGKTSLLDSIRGSAITAKEAGGITQAIGASIIPLSTIKKVCGGLLDKLKFTITLPGLLFIDTPGHAAFMSLRKRGGSLADIAILVIDINDGIMPQTRESIDILRHAKTPFIIAANKVDMIEGWSRKKDLLVDDLNAQDPSVVQRFETKLYEIVGQLYELGLQADRFDRVGDYTKQVAIVPTSAKTGEGIPELLMVMTGLAQRFLEDSLKVEVSGPAKGTILEVKEQKGLGTVLDVIIYDGSLKVNDKILIATQDGVVESKVKALLEPAKHEEMREKKAKFVHVDSVRAATGVRIIAPKSEGALAGTPLLMIDGNAEEARKALESELKEVLIETDKDGLIVKADSLGSLEALMTMLKESGISVRKSSIGPITKKDVADAEAILKKDALHGVILGFNIPKPDIQTSALILCDDIIYRLIEEYEKWRDEQRRKTELSELENITAPCKIEILKGYVFRQSNPAIVGVEVIYGALKSNTPLMNKKGDQVAFVKGIRLEKEAVDKAERGKQVSVSLQGVTIGRQVNEGDVLYSAISEDEFRKYKEFRDHLTEDQKLVLKEIAEIMREKKALWGV
ncbi:translation initiation factor IF-2 [Candidatus Woesearchaeota archaeon]|nr:MAG: translation initiation factor IF-2 [Candidatus Woesearchaeota archaeon]